MTRKLSGKGGGNSHDRAVARGKQEPTELLPPRPEQMESGPNTPPERMPRGLAIAGITVSALAFCFGIFEWASGQFLALRGVQHMLISRLFLGISYVSL